MKLHQKIEAVLFFKAGPVKIRTLCEILGIDEKTLAEGVEQLTSFLAESGLSLLRTESELQLTTTPDADELITALRRDEMKRDIGKAGAETLSIILYRGPISRAEIDRIRGVNSSFILRNLLMRGLVERTQKGNTFLFSETTELLAHLGISHKSELPNYAQVLDRIEAFEREQESQKAYEQE